MNECMTMTQRQQDKLLPFLQWMDRTFPAEDGLSLA